MFLFVNPSAIAVGGVFAPTVSKWQGRTTDLDVILFIFSIQSVDGFYSILSRNICIEHIDLCKFVAKISAAQLSNFYRWLL